MSGFTMNSRLMITVYIIIVLLNFFTKKKEDQNIKAMKIASRNNLAGFESRIENTHALFVRN